MTPKDRNPKPNMEQALDELRKESAAPDDVERAAATVWTYLAEQMSRPVDPVPADRIRTCADFQALIPSYLSGTLPDARTLLFEDHTRACVSCRKALRAARSGDLAAAPAILNPPAPSSRRHIIAWGLAAALLIGIGLARFDDVRSLLRSSGAVYAMAQAVDGTLFRVAGQQSRPLTAGERIDRGERVRTAMNSGAVLQLADGSRIEMKERSELSLSPAKDGTTVRLARGSLIVSAAKRRSGHLYVATPDCTISVTGTVFSVNRGAKGSRVSVLEGEVWVEQDKAKHVLHSGDQLATHAGIGSAPLEQEIAWSKNVDAHLGLLRAFSVLNKELQGRTSGPALRYRSQLLPLAPQETVLYAAFPNISAALADAYDIFQRQINQNPALSQWWSDNRRAAEGKPDLETMISKIRTLGEFLGDEVVVAVSRNRAGAYNDPLLLAEVRRPADLIAFLQAELSSHRSPSGETPTLRVIENPAELLSLPADSRTHEPVLFMHNQVIAASSSIRTLQELAGRSPNPGDHPFSATGFYRRIAGAYTDGVGWLMAADMETLFADAPQKNPHHRREQDRLWLDQMGIADVQHLLLEQKSVAGKTEHQAALSFNQPRRGMTAWLAPPAPMDALEFVSPDAYGVAAFVIKEPARILNELLGLLQKSDPKGWQSLQDFEAQRGVSLRADLAAPLGGEFLVAVDGPLLPMPSWKVILEVYDPARLQKTLQWAMDEINREAASAGKPGLSLVQETADGKIFYKLAAQDSGYELHYLYWDGYLLAAPSRTLLIQALQYRATGYTLPTSPAFRAQLPGDGRTHCSALFYQNVLSAVGGFAKYMPDAKGPLNAQQLKSLEEFAATSPPMLVSLYGERDRIVLAGQGDLLLNLGTLAGLNGLQHRMAGPGPHQKPMAGKAKGARAAR